MTYRSKSLPHQVFNLMQLGIRFDVDFAKAMVGFPYAEPDAHLPVDVLRWALLGVQITEQHVHKVDLTKPLILGTLGPWKFLLDGHHRLTRAVDIAAPSLGAYILNKYETRRVCSNRRTYDRMAKLANALPTPIFYDRFVCDFAD